MKRLVRELMLAKEAERGVDRDHLVIVREVGVERAVEGERIW